jgi:hypothetical protein
VLGSFLVGVFCEGVDRDSLTDGRGLQNAPSRSVVIDIRSSILGLSTVICQLPTPTNCPNQQPPHRSSVPGPSTVICQPPTPTDCPNEQPPHRSSVPGPSTVICQLYPPTDCPNQQPPHRSSIFGHRHSPVNRHLSTNKGSTNPTTSPPAIESRKCAYLLPAKLAFGKDLTYIGITIQI